MNFINSPFRLEGQAVSTEKRKELSIESIFWPNLYDSFLLTNFIRESSSSKASKKVGVELKS